MSQKTSWPNNKGLKKNIQGYNIYLGKSWDLVHGKGWFCQVFDNDYHMGFGFSKKSKFKAVREALSSN